MAVGLEIYKGTSPLDYALNYMDKEHLDLIEDYKEFRSLLERCFDKDYHKRPSANELAEDDFFKEYIE
jgi:serine/threonine protein kinase